ncbi:MAG: HU family DNA-binding protein [Firmicutes bacterium]|nr:HU family DNA-binding protein [Bacillota bacterium]
MGRVKLLRIKQNAKGVTTKMRKVNTPDVIQEISIRMCCYKKDVAELLGHFANVVIENVAAGRAVAFKDLGVFYPCQNTVQGKSLKITNKLKFRPAKKLILAMSQNNSFKEGDCDEKKKMCDKKGS